MSCGESHTAVLVADCWLVVSCPIVPLECPIWGSDLAYRQTIRLFENRFNLIGDVISAHW